MLVLSIVPVHIKNRDGEYPANYSLTYEGMTVIMEDTAILAATPLIIDIGSEIIPNSRPDDLIPLSPAFDYVLIEFYFQSDIFSLYMDPL